MKIILVEDDEYKANQIKAFLNRFDNDVIIKRSYKTGMQAIVNTKCDIVLLDMTIPSFEISATHPSSRSRKYGGRDILNEMYRKELPTPAIVITQYKVFDDGEKSLDDLDKELLDKYPQIYKGIVYYNASILDWQDKLQNLIDKVNRKDC